MKAGARIAPEAYRRLDLHAHALLHDVPLHDVWEVFLPGGGDGRSLKDLRALMSLEELGQMNRAVRFLFGLRRLLGRTFGWDDDSGTPARPSLHLARVPPEILARSDPPPGTPDGPFALLYATGGEAVSEVRNATVHAFSVLALERSGDGYRAVLAIHVAPVGPGTRFYMALIDPFRRFVVYPALLRHLQRRWRERYGADA